MSTQALLDSLQLAMWEQNEGRGQAHVLSDDWLEAPRHSTPSLCADLTLTWGLWGFFCPSLGLTEGVNELNFKTDLCKDTKGKMMCWQRSFQSVYTTKRKVAKTKPGLAYRQNQQTLTPCKCLNATCDTAWLKPDTTARQLQVLDCTGLTVCLYILDSEECHVTVLHNRLKAPGVTVVRSLTISVLTSVSAEWLSQNTTAHVFSFLSGKLQDGTCLSCTALRLSSQK